ncbi:hypothetical protein EON65_03315 [archaeon]|nr:MAG: hypothetical protein EON65_03315 [archaeon]
MPADIYTNGLHLGYDYQNIADVVTLINTLTGRTDSPQPEKIEQTLASGEYSYKYYYWTHRLADEDVWFNAGQILDTHVSAVVTAGYKTVISFRTNGEATAHLPTDPIGAVDNHEFSDSAGLYSVALEESAVTAAGLGFLSLPVESGQWTVDMFNTYAPKLQAASLSGPVLAHCASGYRSAAFVLTYLAHNQRLCMDWVLAKGREVGFDYHNPTPTANDLEILEFMFDVLQC